MRWPQLRRAASEFSACRHLSRAAKSSGARPCSQRLAAPHLPFAGVCHNAIDVDTVPFGATPESYLAFLGRMAPEKGAAEAIVLAREAGRPLLIAAKCREPAERAYFVYRRRIASQMLGSVDIIAHPGDMAQDFQGVMEHAMGKTEIKSKNIPNVA